MHASPAPASPCLICRCSMATKNAVVTGANQGEAVGLLDGFCRWRRAARVLHLLAPPILHSIPPSSGIGLEIVRLIAQRPGTRTVLTARNEERGRAAVAKLQSELPPAAAERVCFAQLDITSPASIEGFRQWAQKELQQVDVLINNAGERAGSWAWCGYGTCPLHAVEAACGASACWRRFFQTVAARMLLGCCCSFCNLVHGRLPRLRFTLPAGCRLCIQGRHMGRGGGTDHYQHKLRGHRWVWGGCAMWHVVGWRCTCVHTAMQRLPHLSCTPVAARPPLLRSFGVRGAQRAGARWRPYRERVQLCVALQGWAGRFCCTQSIGPTLQLVCWHQSRACSQH